MELFNKKYRVKSIRLKDWGYSNVGWYYVTICTKKKECYFGEIENGKMILSELGEIVKEFLIRIPNYVINVEMEQL